MTSRNYNIIDAIKDAVTGNLEFASDDVVQHRRSICESCEVRNTTLNTCTVCSCYIPAKTKLKESDCPMEMWYPVDG